MKDFFLGVLLCLAGGGIIFFLEKFKVNNALLKATIRVWMLAIILVFVGLYFMAKFFGVDFKV